MIGRRRALAGLLAVAAALPARRLGAQPPPPPAPPRPPAAAKPPALAPEAAPPPGPEPRPGVPAPPAVVGELTATLARAIERFEARDVEGVLGYLSDQYWTGPFTKRTVRAQLTTIFQLHQQVRARVRIDEVRLVGAHAWVYTTGDISGQLAVVNQWLGLFAWQRELEVARRESGAWRLWGYQQ